MRTNIKGDIGELLVMTQLLKKGYWVSKPFGDDCPYDIICDDKLGVIKRVQVKFITPKNGTIRCKLYSETGVSYKETVEWIMLVDSVTEICCFSSGFVLMKTSTVLLNPALIETSFRVPFSIRTSKSVFLK